MSNKRRLAIFLVLALAGTFVSSGQVQANSFRVFFFGLNGTPMPTSEVVQVMITTTPTATNPAVILYGPQPYHSGDTILHSVTRLDLKLAPYADKSVSLIFIHGGTATIDGLFGNSPRTQVLNVVIPDAESLFPERHPVRAVPSEAYEECSPRRCGRRVLLRGRCR